MYYTQATFPVGTLTLVSDGTALTQLLFPNEEEKNFMNYQRQDDLPVFTATISWLQHYFAGAKPDASELSLKPQGTPFQLAVWEKLRQIPYGTVTTYGTIAASLAVEKGITKMSSRAVGNAVGRNPLGIIVPCHRVVGVNHNLTGFGGGIPLKRQLLALEGLDLTQYRDPKIK
ncbi:methylated-DNA--[protein]-cysteine S-methyltransferase [Enterococcus nangangensis]|uniref:methylated-DNA--[protein]-cysteine S-methyltransferase n=1 Tax=Enterococcus nangangensis TaxID=2559926 RepID=UPI0010F57972|nr:methylated-DNA--[protein]-cysteine S-methyltransferase [Enterococcus nangangensis]